MKKRANIKDVSKVAGISPSTVSNYLNKKAPVNKETAKRIKEAIERLNYQPNIPARNLRNRKTQSILVIVANVANIFFYEVINGIEFIAEKTGYQILLGDAKNDINTERNFLNMLRQNQFDGILLLTARENYANIELLAREYPLVLACQYYKSSKLPTVSIDNISAARECIEHLIKMGHKRIAFINGLSEVVVFKDRLEGYSMALKRSGLEIDPELILEGDCSFKSGYDLTMKLIGLEKKITAIFAASDEMALGVIKALKKHNFKVPEDIAVIGFDDTKLAVMSEPELTAIRQPMFDIGEKAMELLLKIIQGEKIYKKKIILEHNLIIRKSCGFTL